MQYPIIWEDKDEFAINIWLEQGKIFCFHDTGINEIFRNVFVKRMDSQSVYFNLHNRLSGVVRESS